jgi:hypothetical protein
VLWIIKFVRIARRYKALLGPDPGDDLGRRGAEPANIFDDKEEAESCPTCARCGGVNADLLPSPLNVRQMRYERLGTSVLSCSHLREDSRA